MKNKKRLISFVLMLSLFFTNLSINIVHADPTIEQEVLENQEKYDEMSENIAKLENEIILLETEINELNTQITECQNEISELNTKIEESNANIEKLNKEIEETFSKLDVRIIDLYKNRSNSNYLIYLLQSDSIPQLIDRIEAISRMVTTDNKIINELNDLNAELEKNKEELESAKSEVEEKNNSLNEKLTTVENNKNEQNKLMEEAKQLQKEFEKDYLAVSERKLISMQTNTIDNSNSIDELNSAISQLKNIRDGQIKSDIVKNEINNLINKGTNKISSIKLAQSNSAAGAPKPGSTGNTIVDYAYNFLGCPYVWGATGPNSFDCSGFTQYVYKHAAGIDISRTTYTQINKGTKVSYNDLQPGDLVFPHSGHVGIYVGNGYFIHAPHSGDVVKVSKVYAFYTARRIL